MYATEDQLEALQDQRKRSAAKVQALLEQLEEAEKDFAALTEKLNAFRESLTHARVPRQGLPRIQPRSGEIR